MNNILMTYSYIFIVVFGFMYTFSLNAQDELPAEEREVLKAFEARLAEAKRYTFSPGQLKMESTPKVFSYKLSLEPVDIEYPPPYIRPIAMTADEKIKSGYGLIKAGYGSIKNPFLLARINKSIENYYNLGLLVDYQKFEDQNIQNKKLSDFDAAIYLDYFITESTIANLNLGAGIHNVHFYGFNEGNVLGNISEADRKYNSFFVNGSLENIHELDDENIHYSSQINYHYVKASDLNRTENDIKVEAKVSKNIDAKNQFSLIGGVDLSFFKDSLSKTRHHLYVRPVFQLNANRFHLQLAGLGKSDGEKFHLFPDSELSYALSSRQFILFAGAKGDLKKNNMKSVVDYNPYFNLTLDSLIDTRIYRFYGGLRGVLNNLSYSFEAGYKTIDNHFLFLNDQGDLRQFQILYDDMNVPYASLDIGYELNENVALKLKASHNIFQLKNEDQAWHLLPTEINLAVQAELLDGKIKLVPELIYRGKYDFYGNNDTAEKSKLLMDANLNISYQIQKQISLFVEGKNLGSGNYQRWYGYNNFGIYILGGASVQF